MGQPRAEHTRKLPDYEELKRLYYDLDMSYQEIADKFSCTRSAVVQNVRYRARKRGEWPWPLPAAGLRERQRRNMRRPRIPSGRYAIRLELRLQARQEYVHDFAHRHHISREYLYSILNGDRDEITVDFAARLDKAFHQDLADEASGDGQPTGPDSSPAARPPA